MTKFSDKTHLERHEHIESLIRWKMIGAHIDYSEEEFNYCTTLQKDTLVHLNKKHLKPFEIEYIRNKKIDNVLK